MAEIQCRIRENAKILGGIKDLTDTWEAGFAKILAWDLVLGKKTVLGVEITGVQDAGLS